jgi:hypothetical protein
MGVDVDKVTTHFLGRVEDRYNVEEYYVDSCYKGENKYSARTNIRDLSLEIFFRKNNYIFIGGKRYTYCTASEGKRKIKLVDLNHTDEKEVKIINHYLEDRWEKVEW